MATSKWGPSQVYSTGFVNTRALLHSGSQTHDQNIPLGTYVDDGLKRFRWCHHTAAVADSSSTIVKRGALLRQGITLVSGANVSGYAGLPIFACAVYPYGGKGDQRIKLFSAASFMSQPDK